MEGERGGVENAHNYEIKFGACPLFFFFTFGNSNRDGSKQKITFYAHLLSKVTEVGKVWLLLGGFLGNADKMRNLERPIIGSDQRFVNNIGFLHLMCEQTGTVCIPVKLMVSEEELEEGATTHFLPLKSKQNITVKPERLYFYVALRSHISLFKPTNQTTRTCIIRRWPEPLNFQTEQ